VADRDHLSIGEVLSLLQGEFDDITISKIRFLETQDLLDPERTPSGYRKFYPADVARLRWILQQQKDHFLPLKVIRARLANDPPDFEAMALGDADAATDAARPPSGSSGSDKIFEPPGGGRLARAEVMKRTGLGPADLRELERIGLLGSVDVGGEKFYDDEAVAVAKLAGAFGSRGVEVRHLRMYKLAAEREAGVYEQLLAPLLKQRGGKGRVEAVKQLEDLARLGEGIRAAMLRQALSKHLG
jgi:DNA-binding transcriptional MerR regulator